MPTVRIISIWSKVPGAEGRLMNRSENFEYDVEVPAKFRDGRLDVEGTLDRAFARTNRDDRPHNKRCCSTSAGDVMVLGGKHYLVAGHGFKELTPEESKAIQALTSRDTSFGYDWLKKQNLI
jgi:hypothetical protein